jgi:hypothetical protein
LGIISEIIVNNFKNNATSNTVDKKDDDCVWQEENKLRVSTDDL